MIAADIVRELLAAEDGRGWERWASFLHPDVRYVVVPWGTTAVGKAGYVRHMQRVYEEIPDWEFRVVHLVGGQQTVIGKFERNIGGQIFTFAFFGTGEARHVPGITRRRVSGNEREGTPFVQRGFPDARSQK